MAVAWPVALAAIFTSVYWPFNPVSSVSDITHALFWLAAMIYGFVLGRQSRFADHRRWMLRSFLLCVSIIINRIVTVPVEAVTSFLSTRVSPVASNIASVHSIHPGSAAWFLDASAIDSWLGWTVTGVVAQRAPGRSRIPLSRPKSPDKPEGRHDA